MSKERVAESPSLKPDSPPKPATPPTTQPTTQPTFTPERIATRPTPTSALSVSVRLPTRADVARKRYWCGLMKECPVDVAHVGVVTFCKRTAGEGQNIVGIAEANVAYDGALVWLTDEDLKTVLDALPFIGITVSGRTALTERLTHHEQDALAFYAYMAEVDDDFKPFANAYRTPKPLAVRAANSPTPRTLDYGRGEAANRRQANGVMGVELDDDAPVHPLALKRAAENEELARQVAEERAAAVK